MPLRDFEFAQTARQTNKISISPKWLLKPLDCQPEKCDGACCRKHHDGMTAHYHNQELEKLPKELHKFLCCDGSTIKADEQGNCLLIPYCMKNPAIIPTECRLFPLGFNKSGRLILRRAAWTAIEQTKRCPFYGQGKPIYISLKQCLIDVFGENLYGNIVEQMESFIDRTNSS